MCQHVYNDRTVSSLHTQHNYLSTRTTHDAGTHQSICIYTIVHLRYIKINTCLQLLLFTIHLHLQHLTYLLVPREKRKSRQLGHGQSIQNENLLFHSGHYIHYLCEIRYVSTYQYLPEATTSRCPLMNGLSYSPIHSMATFQSSSNSDFSRCLWHTNDSIQIGLGVLMREQESMCEHVLYNPSQTMNNYLPINK